MMQAGEAYVKSNLEGKRLGLHKATRGVQPSANASLIIPGKRALSQRQFHINTSPLLSNTLLRDGSRWERSKLPANIPMASSAAAASQPRSGSWPGSPAVHIIAS